ncbi:MAG TPA: glutathione S-transferase [Gammaproteobacteria bacterium]|nr:glutathione S-transferase [Gammaproteobacteria bacterium]|tara:strand:+ start:1640 stop:2287 length:648 start_codon:yes stop_codon:yes gene_type:complete
MYKLYGSLGAASLAPHCVLEASGEPYEFIPVDISDEVERDPEYLKLNPHGRVPTLVMGGEIMMESAAISIYLADKHPEANMAPTFDASQRWEYLQWMTYLTNTLQETMLLKRYSSGYTTDSDSSAVSDSAAERLNHILHVVGTGLEKNGGPFFLGDSLSIADIYLNMVLGWDPDIGAGASETTDWPNITKNYDALFSRDDVAKILLENGFPGPTS